MIQIHLSNLNVTFTSTCFKVNLKLAQYYKIKMDLVTFFMRKNTFFAKQNLSVNNCDRFFLVVMGKTLYVT